MIFAEVFGLGDGEAAGEIFAEVGGGLGGGGGEAGDDGMVRREEVAGLLVGDLDDDELGKMGAARFAQEGGKIGMSGVGAVEDEVDGRHFEQRSRDQEERQAEGLGFESRGKGIHRAAGAVEQAVAMGGDGRGGAG